MILILEIYSFAGANASIADVAAAKHVAAIEKFFFLHVGTGMCGRSGVRLDNTISFETNSTLLEVQCMPSQEIA
jgi:hypothetical protein